MKVGLIGGLSISLHSPVRIASHRIEVVLSVESRVPGDHFGCWSVSSRKSSETNHIVVSGTERQVRCELSVGT